MDFNELLSPLGLKLSLRQLNQFEDYYDFLVKYNEKVNLTAITAKEDVYIKHFYDSILLSQAYNLQTIETLCDVGSGAGFPSIPLKILFPHIKITIVDSLDKRITFLKELCKILELNDVNLVHARAEEYVKDHRESFDLVTARAVARQNILNELCLPLTKVNGVFVSMKGKMASEEISEGNSLEILKGKVISKKEYLLPKEESQRTIITIKHYSKAPDKYPRSFSAIKNKPL